MTSADQLPKVSLLTAGKDPHYALGMLECLLAKPFQIDFIANDEMASSPMVNSPRVKYLNLRGDQSVGVSLWKKMFRVTRYYLALLRYAAITDSKLFHILWQNKFDWLDNTLLILFYRLMGKKLVFTAHNVSTRERDGRGGLIDHLSLGYLYRHVDQIFVHTALMKSELVARYSINPEKVVVIPFGVNNVIPRTALDSAGARKLLGIEAGKKVLLFFGNIAPYKGLDLLIEAMVDLSECHLLVVGRVKDCEPYWQKVEESISAKGFDGQIRMRIDYVPDEEVEIYFKAADLVVLPYKKIYQSGVIFLSYSFGIPVIVTNVGALAESVEEGTTGYVAAAEDSRDLAEKIDLFFSSDLYRNRESSRQAIIAYVNDKYSWTRIADETVQVYSRLVRSLRADSSSQSA